jgi:hypothetical protein
LAKFSTLETFAFRLRFSAAWLDLTWYSGCIVQIRWHNASIASRSAGEIVAALEGASNRLIDVEASSEEELETLECHYGELAELAGKHVNLAESHPVEEARERHSTKRPRRQQPDGRTG